MMSNNKAGSEEQPIKQMNDKNLTLTETIKQQQQSTEAITIGPTTDLRL